VSFVPITLCVASQRVFIVVSVYFVIDSVRKLLGTPSYVQSRDNSVGIALGYGLDDWDSRVRFPAGAGNFSLHHRVQNVSGAHHDSSPRGTFPGGGVKQPGHEADHSFPSSAELECMELYLHSPNTPSWRGAQLKHRNNFTFTSYVHIWDGESVRQRSLHAQDHTTQINSNRYLCLDRSSKSRYNTNQDHTHLGLSGL
jgi:hypothetical protein